MNAKDRYDSLIAFYCEQFGLDAAAFKRQMLAESAGNPKAISPCGAMGLLQFMPLTFKEVYPKGQPFNPEDSILAGATYMARLLKAVGGDLPKALASYNWGIGNLQKCLRAYGAAWRDHLPLETSNYLKRILGAEAAPKP